MNDLSLPQNEETHLECSDEAVVHGMLPLRLKQLSLLLCDSVYDIIIVTHNCTHACKFTE